MTKDEIIRDNEKFLFQVKSKTSDIIMSEYVSRHPNIADILDQIAQQNALKRLETSTPSELKDHGLIILNNSDTEAFFWEVLYIESSGQSKVDPFETPSMKRKLLIQTIYEKNAS